MLVLVKRAERVKNKMKWKLVRKHAKFEKNGVVKEFDKLVLVVDMGNGLTVDVDLKVDFALTQIVDKLDIPEE
jgi:hypothetical protein